MASKPNQRAASSEVAKYLDLLNSFEAVDDRTSQGALPPEDERAEAAEFGAVSEAPSAGPDLSNSSVDQDATSENRFAAHIVHGMSKLNRS